MNIIKTIRDTDIGSDFPTPNMFRERRAARALVFDGDKKVALLDATAKGYHKLPGGGIEEGESVESALRREVLEEIGCEIENIRELGIIEGYRNDLQLHQISYCFIADLSGKKGAPHLEKSEIEDGFETVWMTLDEAIAQLESETNIRHYEGRFIRLRDLTFLQVAKHSL